MTYIEWNERLLRHINCLKGRSISGVKGGIGTLYKEVLQGVLEYPFRHNCGGIEITTPNFNIQLLATRPTYKKDKRKISGYGDIIDSVELCRARLVPNDLEIDNLQQYVDYEYAKERKAELAHEISELKNELADKERAVSELEEIMRVNSYPDCEA